MRKSVLAIFSVAAIVSCSNAPEESLTRGIGVYPGDPDEYFGPDMVPSTESRNLALHRAVWHSSSYDYNLTGQLVTDGIVEESCPYYIDLRTQDGPVAKREREKLFDSNFTSVEVKGGKDAFLELDLHNGSVECDEVRFKGSLECDPQSREDYEVSVLASRDGQTWNTLYYSKGKGVPGTGRLIYGINTAGSQDVSVLAGLKNMAPEKAQKVLEAMKERDVDYCARVDGEFSFFKMVLSSPAVIKWTMEELEFSKDGKPVSVLPSERFHSAWMSEGTADEWIYVDLGAEADIDSLELHWIQRPSSGMVELSSDAENWTKVIDLPADDRAAIKARGRYVRLSHLCSDKNIILSEMQVYGKGGLVPKPKAALAPKGNRLYLSGGNWTLQRASLADGDGAEISTVGYCDSTWIPATVPATVASSYYNIGAIPDIRYDDDQLQISESFFLSDFWYRDVFTLPSEFDGNDLVLNFDGINWKADVYVNSQYAGRIDGAFVRGRFDVTSLVHPGENALAVRIHRNDNPGIIKEQNRITADTNGGVLGADNPTMHCAIGWDWIPTVRGRNIGIWNDVFLSAYDGGVSIDDVFVDTALPLPSTDYAELTPTVTLTNHSASERQASIALTYGELQFAKDVTVAPGQTLDVEIPSQRMERPSLWWPKNYGEQHLYDVTTTVSVGGRVSDFKAQKMGVRQMSYTTDGGVLDLYVNGRRLICNGGNWGYPEINLNYRGREYDIAVAYHADMNYTMIRDWVGQTGDEEFYEACDRHGIMVWQDFWLANPWDGPNPNDNAMFLENAEDYVRKIRNHPSLALYCGRNEGNPPAGLYDELEALVHRLHPGLFYIPHSAEGYVSGNGPYRALPVKEYFLAERGRDRLHSERGMPNVMTYESMQTMLRSRNWWPQTSVWGVHDFTLENAQSCATVNELVETGFGEPSDMKQFTELAQWINYNGYRAMYESRSWERKGLLIWMSHSCWPSMVWQTYDYYMAPTAAYFAVKKASAPVRIQWNPVTSDVEVVNNNAGDLTGLTARARILNYDGKLMWEREVGLDAADDSTVGLFPLDFNLSGLSDVYYIKLELFREGVLIADNFYWEGKTENDYRQLLTLPKAKVKYRCKLSESEGEYVMDVTLANRSSVPALMVRLQVEGKHSGERILPAFYQDNWFSLLPAEEKHVRITFRREDCRGEKPALSVSGFNVR